MKPHFAPLFWESIRSEKGRWGDKRQRENKGDRWITKGWYGYSDEIISLMIHIVYCLHIIACCVCPLRFRKFIKTPCLSQSVLFFKNFRDRQFNETFFGIGYWKKKGIELMKIDQNNEKESPSSSLYMILNKLDLVVQHR